MRKVLIKVPAKLILSGEHAVLYTGKAITCAIDRYMTLKIKPLKRNVIKVKGNGFKIKHKFKANIFLNQTFDNQLELEIIRRFFDFANLRPQGVNIVIKSKIPLNCGLGSSSAIISGILFGLNDIFEANISRDDLVLLATKLEDICHGKSSGIDIVSAVFGGVISFNSGEYEKIPHSFNEIWCVNTGRANFNTKDVVKMVATDGDRINDDMIDEFKKIADALKHNIINNKNIDKLIVKNQQLLDTLGVVPMKASGFIKKILNYGIYGKVCGAGTIAKIDENGGCGVIAIFQKLSKLQIKLLKSLCKQNSWKLKKVNIANAGIEIEKV